jgi:hypothetical protein
MTLKLGESHVIFQNSSSNNTKLTKKISNYIFQFEDKIGQGNFSKVYKGYHQLTSKQFCFIIYYF